MKIKTIEQLARDMGADIFGTSDIKDHVPERFSRTPYALTIGVRLSDFVLDEVENGPTKLYFHHYRTANAYLDRISFACAAKLQSYGFNALAIPASQTTNEQAIAGDFAHKTAANLAGLGFIGKSALFVSHQYGPRVRLATVLTNLPLPTGRIQKSTCGSCTACVHACPCGAITGHSFVAGCSRESLIDAALCSHYMKEKFAMVGRGAVCGICMSVCPYGKKHTNQ